MMIFVTIPYILLSICIKEDLNILVNAIKFKNAVGVWIQRMEQENVGLR